MAKKDDGRVGYEFEDKLKEVFGKIKSKHKFDFHRYTDTKAAKGFVQPQPGDFQICFKDDKSSNHVIIIEAKGSEEIESLKSCASSHIRPQQVGKHKAWLRAGGSAQFWFYCEITGMVEIWDSAHVVEQRAAGKPLNIEERLHVFEYLQLETSLINFFKIK